MASFGFSDDKKYPILINNFTFSFPCEADNKALRESTFDWPNNICDDVTTIKTIARRENFI
jgi:hypothetical protein